MKSWMWEDPEHGRWGAYVSALLPCLLCKGVITESWDCYPGDEDTSFVAAQNSATEIKIQPGYGSSLDGDTFVAYICDKCVRKAAVENQVLWLGNWLFDDPQNPEFGSYPDWTKQEEENE